MDSGFYVLSFGNTAPESLPKTRETHPLFGYFGNCCNWPFSRRLRGFGLGESHSSGLVAGNGSVLGAAPRSVVARRVGGARHRGTVANRAARCTPCALPSLPRVAFDALRRGFAELVGA